MISRDRIVPGLRAAAALALLLLTAGVPVAASAAALTLQEATASPATPDGDRDVASTVWFQGFLADVGTGDPVNATYTVVARIYSLASGGALLWGPETHSNVPIVEGWFNIELGATESPLPSFETPPYYLELVVNGETLSPRSKLASVPSALLSSEAVHPDADWTIDGADVYRETGNVGIGTTSPGTELDVDGTVRTTGFQLTTSPAAGKVLTSNASGVASWQTLPGGGIGGGGTAGYLAEFTDAATIGNSAVYETEGRVAIGTTTTTGAKLTVQNAGALPVLSLTNTSTDNGMALLSITKTQPLLNANEMIGMYAPDTSVSGSWIHCYAGGQSGFTTPFEVAIDGEIYSSGGANIYDDVDTNALYVASALGSDDAAAIYGSYVSAGGYNGTGVYGESKLVDYRGYGGRFEGGYTGAQGKVTATGSEFYYGLCGEATGGTGACFGVSGYAYGTGSNYGVTGSASGGSTNWAGYFSGNVRVTGTLTNPLAGMEIDDPTDPANGYLRHPYVASNEMKTVYDGTVVLDASGEATVEMPDWFESLNAEFRYQLTAVGAPGPDLYVAGEIAGNAFRIAGGEPGAKVCWQVTGVRHDAVAAQRGFDVRVPKTGDDRGRYLDAVAHGVPAELEIGPRDERLED